MFSPRGELLLGLALLDRQRARLIPKVTKTNGRSGSTKGAQLDSILARGRLTRERESGEPSGNGCSRYRHCRPGCFARLVDVTFDRGGLADCADTTEHQRDKAQGDRYVPSDF